MLRCRDRPDTLEGWQHWAPLSRREEEVLALLAQGWKRSAIAEALQISPHTVEAHCHHVCQKRGLATMAQCIVYAVYRRVYGLTRM